MGRALAYLKDGRVSKGIDSWFMLDLLMPGSVKDNDIPKNDAFKRLFGERYSAWDISITRSIKDIADVNDEFAKNKYQLGGYFYEIGGRYSGSVLEGWDDILLKSLYCDISGFDNVDYAILRKLSDGVGNYLDTHQLLALFLLEGNRCLDPKKIDSLKSQLIENIVEALNGDESFSDLYAERVVCLFWAEAGHRVKPQWIELIKDAQRPDGSWVDANEFISPSHTTGLSALAIRYFMSPRIKPRFYPRSAD